MNLFEIRHRITLGESIYDLPLRVTFYARVSTDKDAQLNSLDNQIMYFKNLIIDNKNWTYVDGYIDEGISGTSVEKRENFLMMIDDAKKGMFDLILTKEISRFSRSTLDSIKYTQELLNNNVGVIFQSDNINTIMPDSELRLTIMSSIAQEEVRKLSERVKFGFKRSMEKGRVLGNGVIIGYKKSDGKLYVDDDEAEIIKIIFELYSTGNYGLKAISNYLFEKGYKSKNGGYYANSTIKGIIRNPKYKGFYRSNMWKNLDYKSKKKIKLSQEDWIIHKDEVGNVPAIISEELWEKCNEVLNEKTCGFCKKVKNSDSFKTTTTYGGLMFCAEHNKPFRRHTDSRSFRHIWICDEQHRNGLKGCASAILYEKELDEIFKEVINNLLKNREEIVKHLFELYKQSCNTKDYVLEQKKIDDKIKDINIKKNRILDFLISETISKEDYKRRISELDLEIKKLDDKKILLKSDEQYEKEIIKKYKELDFEIKKEIDSDESFPKLVRLLVDRVVVNKIDGDRHKVKLDIYINVLGEKITVCNKTFLKDNSHPSCSHQQNSDTCG